MVVFLIFLLLGWPWLSDLKPRQLPQPPALAGIRVLFPGFISILLSKCGSDITAVAPAGLLDIRISLEAMNSIFVFREIPDDRHTHLVPEAALPPHWILCCVLLAMPDELRSHMLSTHWIH